MVAELKKILGTLNPENVDIMDVNEMQKLLKKIILNMRCAEEPAVPEPGEADDDKDLIQAISNFRGQHTSKPSPWNGEDEKAFKSWTQKFTMYMSNAGDKIWRNILKKIKSLSNDADLEDEKKVNTLLKSIRINPWLPRSFRRACTTSWSRTQKLLSDVHIAGPYLSFNSYRKAYQAGKKKTAENIHLARNKVSRPAIAENMDEWEEKFKKWKKDIAYLKDIDAYDYRDNGMISILLDFVPDEVQKEITMKYATVGSNAIDLRTAMLEVERTVEREKDRVQRKKDRQTKGKISALQEEIAEDLCVWNNESKSSETCPWIRQISWSINVPIIIDAFLLLNIQIRMSSSGYVNVFQWNREWFLSRRVKFDSWFNVMAVYEVSWHGPEIVYRFTGIRKWVLRLWKRPFCFSKKVNITLSLNWSMPYQGGCSQFLISFKGFWFVHLRLEK